jgi:copper chaperone
MSQKTQVLIVEGMSCSHCENSVKKSVGALEGVSKVSVDLSSKKVTVDFDMEKVALAKIEETIEDQGYEVSNRES